MFSIIFGLCVMVVFVAIILFVIVIPLIVGIVKGIRKAWHQKFLYNIFGFVHLFCGVYQLKF